MEKVLVIAPHADDEVLGCGGTIAKYAKAGYEVYVLIMTNASIGAPELFTTDQVHGIRKEAILSHNLLGVKKTFFEDFPAPSLNAYPEYKLSIAISKVVNVIKPTIVFVPHPGDMHQDHKAIYRSALVALRPQGDIKVKRILCYETLSETDWTPMNEKPFVPNYFIDITNSFDDKISSMECFKSQLKDFPHSRSLEALEALAKYRGATIGVKRAEAFYVERILEVD